MSTQVAREPVVSSSDICLYILAIFIPPLPVFMKRGCGCQFWLNILLTIFAWVPGVIHAWYIILRSEERAVYTTPGPYSTY